MQTSLYELVGNIRSCPVYIFTGPSGAGKDTVIRELTARRPDVFTTVPFITTRPLHNMEVDGVYSHSIPLEEFERKTSQGKIIFSGNRYGFSYGTDKEELASHRRTGKVVIIQTSSTDALKQMYETFPYARTVSVVPYMNIDNTIHRERTASRIRSRQPTISDRELDRRLDENLRDMSFYLDKKNWDYLFLNDSTEGLSGKVESLLQYISEDTGRRKSDEPLSSVISRFKQHRPDYRFSYPLGIFSEVRISDAEVDVKNRNAFLNHARPTDENVVMDRARFLSGLDGIIEYLLLGRRIISVSLMGSYVYPWITTSGDDIDINVFYEGNGFQHRIVPVTEIPDFRDILPSNIRRLEIVTIGDQNAVHGKPVDDSFSGATKHENVVGIITSGLWNRDIPVYGHDYVPISNNEINLLRLSYDLIESAVRRHQNIQMEKPEPELKRLRKSIGRSAEAEVYLEEICLGLTGNHSRIFLPQETELFSEDEIRFYADYMLGRTIERYLKFRDIITA